MLSIRTAYSADKPAITRLMSTVFGHSEEGIALFFSQAFSWERCIVAQEGSEVCGMFHILPATLRFAEGSIPVAYLYALAVTPERRGRGVASEIMRYLEWFLPRQGYDAAALCPTGQELFNFYRRFGYGSAVSVKSWEFLAERLPKEEAAVTSIALRDLPGGRASFFPGCSPVFCWDERMLTYVQSNLSLYDGEVGWIEGENFCGYAVFRERERRLYVSELGGENPDKLLGALCAATGAVGGTVALPQNAAHGRDTPYAAVHFFSHERPVENGYMSPMIK